jgi:small ligand-binding sensory domain FIST
MKCSSALSTHAETDVAVREALDALASGLAGQTADLAVAFVSPHHARGLRRLGEEIRGQGLTRHVLGCTGESIVGSDREIEASPAVSIWAGVLPDTIVTPFRPRPDAEGIREIAPSAEGDATEGRIVLLLGDPFTFPADNWLRAVNVKTPRLRVAGGMASAAHSPGSNALLLDDEIYRDGAVAVQVDGPITMRTVVSQGCRPIGRPLIVTKVEENVIKELGRRPALEVVREMFEALEPEEQELVRQGLHVGRVINEYQDKFRRGDFLVRNVLGADDDGGIGISEVVRVGQTVQFHVRDAATADEDLNTLLAEAEIGGQARGALLFTCNGRGTRLFAEAHHDVRTIQSVCGRIPVAGFFAMGELGPIGGQNFVHGFTASIVLFEDARA